MCLDSCGHSEEQTYEESDTLSPLILTDGEEPRASVIWKLAEAVRFAKTCLKDKFPDINIYGLLLTEANILNAYNNDVTGNGKRLPIGYKHKTAFGRVYRYFASIQHTRYWFV